MSNVLKYTDPIRVMNMAHDGYRSNVTTGGKVPTPFRLYYAGKFKRVYAMVYGNSPSLYIIHNGVDLFLDAKTRDALNKVPRTITS